MSGVAALLGENLQCTDGTTIKTSSWVEPGKVVGMYFSAHWCPPCRAFTPQLAEWYKKFKETDNGKKFEMVFVSSDRDEASFNEYYKEMPWHALPYSERETKAKLSGKFKVQGIPTLVLIDADTGKLITNKGREKVTSDPEGADFPWRPKALNEILTGNVLKHGEGSLVEQVDLATAIKGKVLGIYFSAHWCPPCRAFTPDLAKLYKKLKEEKKDFEILFVSSDKDDEGFKDYWNTMPWLAIPLGDSRKNQLSDHFEVEGIPDLKILDGDLKVINNEGRGAVGIDPEGKDFPWVAKALNPLLSHTAGKINGSATLIYLTGGDAALEKAAPEMMQEIAETYVKEYESQPGDNIPELAFLYEVEDSDDMVESLREFLKLGDKAPILVIVNIPEQKKYVYNGVITKDKIQEIVNKFKAGKVEFSALR